MSNQYIVPPGVGAVHIGETEDGDAKLVNEDEVTEEQTTDGETTEDQATVNQDVREAESVNENLDE